MRQQIGEYLVTRELGRGGMGTVHEAIERLSRRPVALKVMHERLATSSHGRERFLSEMGILAGLDHPNVVRLLACFEDRVGLVMVLELIRGETLRASLRRLGRLNWSDATVVTRQILRGLSAAHQGLRPVVHRDLKPPNVMITYEGVVKVMDFGIAKIVRSQTEATADVGTVQYMSPEQVDARAIDPRSDLFSLGVLLYEMLAGVRPFRSTSRRELLGQICTMPAPGLPPEVASACPPALIETMHALLAKSPDDRPCNAASVLRMLERVNDGGALSFVPGGPASDPVAAVAQSGPHSTPHGSGAWPSGSQAVAPAAVASNVPTSNNAAATEQASTAASGPMATEATRSRAAAPIPVPPRRNASQRNTGVVVAVVVGIVAVLGIGVFTFGMQLGAPVDREDEATPRPRSKPTAPFSPNPRFDRDRASFRQPKPDNAAAKEPESVEPPDGPTQVDKSEPRKDDGLPLSLEDIVPPTRAPRVRASSSSRGLRIGDVAQYKSDLGIFLWHTLPPPRDVDGDGIEDLVLVDRFRNSSDLRLISGNTLRRIWSTNIAHEGHPKVGVFGELVVVATDFEVRGFDIKSGGQRWSTKAISDKPRSVVLFDGAVLVQSIDNRVVRIDPQDGNTSPLGKDSRAHFHDARARPLLRLTSTRYVRDKRPLKGPWKAKLCAIDNRPMQPASRKKLARCPKNLRFGLFEIGAGTPDPVLASLDGNTVKWQRTLFDAREVRPRRSIFGDGIAQSPSLVASLYKQTVSIVERESGELVWSAPVFVDRGGSDDVAELLGLSDRRLYLRYGGLVYVVDIATQKVLSAAEE